MLVKSGSQKLPLNRGSWKIPNERELPEDQSILSLSLPLEEQSQIVGGHQSIATHAIHRSLS